MSFKITSEQIHARASDQSFSRGQSLFKNDAIFDTVQRDNELIGYCEASSQPEPYIVRATLNKDGIVSASCTCPYEFGGDCKHIVALLLTYLNKPKQFEQRQSLDKTLATRDKDALVSLIRKMIDRYPDLESLIDLPVPSKTKRSTPVDTAVFRKQIRSSLRGFDEWYDPAAARTLNTILSTAAEFADKGDWRSASAIYRTVIDECIRADEYPITEDDGFVEAFDESIQRLAACLEQRELADDDQERRAVLDSLLAAYLWNSGGDLGADAPDYILRYARQSDIPGIREKVKAAQRRQSRWAGDALAEFMIELDVLDNVDPEVTLARLRDEGMYSLLVRKLIELKRLDEAVEVVENQITEPYERLMELPRLVAAGREDDAIRLAKKALQPHYDSQIAGWLLERYKARGDWESYVQLQQQELQANPAEHNYVLLKEAAEKTGRWQSLRPEVLTWLQKKPHYDVLAKIYLHDQEWDAAWDALAKYEKGTKGRKDGWFFIDRDLDLEVAQRSKTERPEKAIPVLIKYARQQIGKRNRQDYQVAAEYLSSVRDLYRILDDEAAWQKLIDGIRAEFPTLRALQDELKKARL